VELTCGEIFSNLWGDFLKPVGRFSQTCGEIFSNLWGDFLKPVGRFDSIPPMWYACVVAT